MLVKPITPDGVLGRAVLGVLMWRGLGQLAYENGNMTPELIRSQLQPTREEIAAETMEAIRQEKEKASQR